MPEEAIVLGSTDSDSRDERPDVGACLRGLLERRRAGVNLEIDAGSLAAGSERGSGKSGTPCSRMQRALATMPACCAAEIGGGALAPPSRNVAHAFSADSNAGDCSLIPEVRSGKPPPGLGSGKFGTSCERIQSAYFTAWAYWLDPPVTVLDLLDDPHAAIATAPLTVTTAIDRLRRWLFKTLRLLALGTSLRSYNGASTAISSPMERFRSSSRPGAADFLGMLERRRLRVVPRSSDLDADPAAAGELRVREAGTPRSRMHCALAIAASF